MISLTAQCTMRPGRSARALALVERVRRQSEREQPGTLLYLVHRVLDAKRRPTRSLLFYECYRDQSALDAHLASTSWQALVAAWGACFEGSPTTMTVTGLARLGGFVRLAVPSAD